MTLIVFINKNKRVKKNYMYIHITMLLLCIYVIFYPFISNILSKINPNLVKCAYLTMTGKPCPLCGGTRYFANIGNTFNDPTYLLSPFGIIAIIIIFEIIYRIIAIIYTKKKENIKRFVIIDIIIHAIIFIAFIAYEITFIYIQNT